ncbi:thromboxane-A synthase-like isoform X2 [Rhincodon typus]|uniref:thromboxane-A synthase-like isoform X2 n=1 Tax=Rhincodon typus TaxID=259920 RepID=UPI00203032B4|nr:thromboxane-A synthase-like isoform X2 [Rhincodon typus]
MKRDGSSWSQSVLCRIQTETQKMTSLMNLVGVPVASIELTRTTVSVGLFMLFLCLLCWYSVAPYSQLKRAGIKHPKPFPFVGNMFFFQKGFFEGLQELVEKYGQVCGWM